MSDPRKLYWDSSCFIAFINQTETVRNPICADVLNNAKNGVVEIWTSMWTIVEVIRPKSPPQAKPLPAWAAEIQKNAPNCLQKVQELWDYHVRQTTPRRKLTANEMALISAMFQWPYINKILVDEPISNSAVTICRDHGLMPADAIHAASAIAAKCDAIQCWDKDYSKVAQLMQAENPVRISAQSLLPLAPPSSHAATPAPPAAAMPSGPKTGN